MFKDLKTCLHLNFKAITTTDLSATGGSDYTSQDGSTTVTLTPGETGNVVVVIIDDNEPESNEQFNVVLGGDDVGSTLTTAVVTITDGNGEQIEILHTNHIRFLGFLLISAEF